MPRISLSRFCLALCAGVVFGSACGESYGLPPATAENTIDTVQLWALTGTPIGTPSAYDAVIALPIRPELGDAFDVAFEIDANGTATLQTASVLGLGGTAGILVADVPFDAVARAPLEDYVVDSVTVVDVGTVVIVRSRTTSAGCAVIAGSLPRYTKAEVIEIDAVERTVTLKTLANINCGYRDLDEGVPAD